MSMPLFDADGRGNGKSDALLSVSQLTNRIKGLLELDFADIAIEGEISNLSRPASGHVYLTLKDDKAQIRAVLWKSTAQRLAFELRNGLSVRVWGGLSVYAPRGEYQITLRRVEPAGQGALELAFRQLVTRLEAEGLFHPGRKRALPSYPTRIAIISSPTGAAVRDVIRVLGQRWPLAELIVVPSLVQGPGAAEALVAAVQCAQTLPDIDFLILARGGGSLEDLWAFNHEGLARAIVASRIPVVSAVGHEVDVTIADLAADLRAPTPSAAGALCSPSVEDVRIRLDELEYRLGRLLHLRTQRARALAAALDQRAAHSLDRYWLALRNRLGQLGQRLENSIQRTLDRHKHRLGHQAARLNALSPLAVLARGYSITHSEATGLIVTDANQVQPGDRLTTRLASGSVISRIERVAPGPASSP